MFQAALSKPVHEIVPTTSSNNTSQPVSTSSTPVPGDIGEDSMNSNDNNMNDNAAALTPETVASWGIIKMNDYLVSGTRQQYWEEYFVKHVMSVRPCPPLHLSQRIEE